MKNILKNRNFGFYLAVSAALLSIISAIAYLCIYTVTADKVTGEFDRVFRWYVIALLLSGAVISLVGETLRIDMTPIVAAVLYGIGMAVHFVQTAYPIADIFTKIKFFGGDPIIAITFSVIFGSVVVMHTVAAFLSREVAQM